MADEAIEIGVIGGQGTELKTWAETGSDQLFFRDYVKPYTDAGLKVAFLSFGPENFKFNNFPENLELLKGKAHRWIYTFLMPFFYWNRIKNFKLIRVMHASGAVTALMIKLIFRIPYVTTYGYFLHKMAFTYGQYIRGILWYPRTALAVWFADAVIVTNPDTEKFIKSLVRKKEKVVFIPNGANTSVFKPIPEIPKPEVFTVVSVGRLNSVKQYHLLIEAASLVSFPIRVRIAGDGEERQALLDLAARLHVDLDLPGLVPNPELPGFLNRSHVFALTSKHEGNPKALLEAMSCACACIGTDVPGINTLITHQKNGLLAPVSAQALATLLESLHQDEEKRCALASAARSFIQEHYNREVLQAREVALLKQIARPQAL